MNEDPATLTGRERFLRAARRQPVDGPPVWFMRQAGRHLPEYHEVRSRGTFMEIVRNPELAAEVTCQPLRRYDLDAAVIFSDILVPPAAMGMEVEIVEKVGPVLNPPIRTRDDVERLRAFDPEVDTAFLGEAIKRTRAELGDEKAIIGFCGAPFTTASYMIEGRSSRNFEHTKKMLYGDRSTFLELMDRIVDALVPYLGWQVDCGADVLQIFDSWGGSLDAVTYRRDIAPSLERLIVAARGLEVPVTLYVNGGDHLLEILLDLGPDVISLDWRTDPRRARELARGRCALQGNLDPCVLLAPPEEVRKHADACLDAFGDEPGHIFNLGSGIIPSLPIEGVQAVIERVIARRTGAS